MNRQSERIPRSYFFGVGERIRKYSCYLTFRRFPAVLLRGIFNLRMVLSVALLLACAGTVMFMCQAPLTVEWTAVPDCRAAGTITATGHITENGILPVHPLTAGPIIRVWVTGGASVAAGDTLVQIDDREERSRLARCRLDVTIAALRLEEQLSTGIALAREKVARAQAFETLAVKQCVRSDSLFLQGSITQAELDEAEKERAVGQSDRQNAETELTAASSSRINLLQAALSQAKLALDDAARALARTVITASVGGVVIDPVVHERGNASPGEPLMRLITGTTRPTAEVRVDEGELAWLRPGQKAYVTCSSCATVDATVQSVIGRIDTTTLTAAVVLEMPQSQPPLIAGRKIFVRILSEGSPGTILLDRRFVSSQESRMYVFIKSGNRALRRLVRSEVIGDEIISIRSGLTPVDTLLYAAGLSECSRIRLNRKPFDAVHFPGL